MTARVRTALCTLLLLTTGILFHWRVALLGRTPHGRDTGGLFYPIHHFWQSCVTRGELPAWLPTDAGGTPVLSLHTAALHPLLLLYTFLPFETAFRWLHVLAVLLGLLGMFGFCRQLGTSRGASVLGAFAFGFSTMFCWSLEFIPIALSLCATPFFLWATVAAIDGNRWARLGATLALGLVVIGGDLQMAPEIAAIAILLGAARGGRRGALHAMGLSLLGLGVGAVHLLPASLVTGESGRAAGLTAAEAYKFSLQWSELLDVFARDPPAAVGGGLIFSIYIGLPVLLLAALAPPKKTALSLMTLAVLCLLAALGPHAPVYGLLRAVVPFWNRFRYPVKLLLPLTLCLAPLAALGADRLGEKRAWLVPLLALVLFADLSRANFDLWYLGPKQTSLTEAPPLAKALANDPGLTYSYQLKTPPSARNREMEEDPNFENLRPQDIGITSMQYSDALFAAALYPPTSSLWGRRSWNGNQWALGSAERFQSIIHRGGPLEQGLELAGAFGVTHVILQTPVPESYRALVDAEDVDHGLAAVRVPNALPPAYVPSAAAQVLPADAVAKVLAPGFAPDHLALVESPSALAPPNADAAGAVPAIVTARGCSTLDVDADFARAGVLVINERMAPGWTATVDGTAAPVWTANALVRAVPAPAGHHRIRLQYMTPGLLGGLLLTVLSILLSLFLTLERQRC